MAKVGKTQRSGQLEGVAIEVESGQRQQEVLKIREMRLHHVGTPPHKAHVCSSGSQMCFRRYCQVRVAEV